MFPLPELPEVELVRRSIAAHCLHRPISTLEVLDEGILEKTTSQRLRRALIGRSFGKIERHGKQIFIKIEKGGWLTVHLGMTGDLICSSDQVGPPRFTRMLVHFEDGGNLVFQDMRKFGAIGLTRSMNGFIKEKGLGPDALAISAEEFVGRASEHGRHIKTVMMDQTVLAGVGNLYSDEALFQCQIHPLTRSNTLSEGQLLCLHEKVQEVLGISIELGTDFGRLPEKYLLRDRRAGSRCPRGHGPLQTIKVNGRTAYLCPECQSR
jgi:formamidopyrimidine-DNA glycosylase